MLNLNPDTVSRILSAAGAVGVDLLSAATTTIAAVDDGRVDPNEHVQLAGAYGDLVSELSENLPDAARAPGFVALGALAGYGAWASWVAAGKPRDVSVSMLAEWYDRETGEALPGPFPVAAPAPAPAVDPSEASDNA